MSPLETIGGATVAGLIVYLFMQFDHAGQIKNKTIRWIAIGLLISALLILNTIIGSPAGEY